MFTSEDQERLDIIDKAISKYTIAITQANLSTRPILDSSAATEKDTVGQNVTGQAVSEQHATEQHATEQHATEQHATEQHATEEHATEEHATEQHATKQHATDQNAAEQNVTVKVLNPRTAHATAQESPLKRREIKKEPAEESKISASRLVDNLNMEWDVDVNSSYVESSLQNLPKDAFGHITRYSQSRYCVRYGSADAHSARFESTLPNGSRYQGTRDVTQRSNRIIERIVQIHRDNKTALPAHILSQVKILLVY
ncbi:hypothetical protein HRS9139_09654 [Pyrenophora teres f. teres]|uniref:Uncharacterized protein n=1 Tax=Pyrenophora teres f. teres TaxID=97479 RepID=A0A6S6WHV7_9PLEO|nr:hypothetical protein HRS9139_09654 [Pyrenophora teres f. teres]KAE8854417.1 hypothetical protein PTNB29_09773 [Pyrenophora teres f. teres]CAE7219892.1 hypothetical protein PTTW11_11236 [Pyrenophora teres f. teres]